MGGRIDLHKVDVRDFIRTVESCEGNVYLETTEGDCFNLKSKLSQLMGLTRLIEGGIIVDATIRCEKPSDESKLVRFDLFHEVPESTNT